MRKILQAGVALVLCVGVWAPSGAGTQPFEVELAQYLRHTSGKLNEDLFRLKLMATQEPKRGDRARIAQMVLEWEPKAAVLAHYADELDGLTCQAQKGEQE